MREREFNERTGKHPTRVRVELRGDDDHRSFKNMLSAFTSQCKKAGIKEDYMKSLEYESEGQKRRRKKLASDLQRKKDLKDKDLQNRLRERFSD